MANLNTRKELEEQAARLQRQRKYHAQYNKGDFITDKEVKVIGGVDYIAYKAGGKPKLRLAREGENIDGLKRTVIS
jgi:hypothetical protein